jgi:4-hydroxy-tetrahydrodipicolinate synthase
MFYNSPQFGMVVSAQGLKRICDIPNVVGVKEASFNQELSVETHLLLGRHAIISTPDEWILFKGKELGFEQQVMFANTSDWRFDRPGENYYVQFIDKAMRGDLDQEFYDAHIRPVKQVSDKWWRSTVQKHNGALPVSMCKFWGELMGMAGGHVRPPLMDLSEEEKSELKRDLGEVQR